MSQKYPNIVSNLPDDLVDKFAESMAQSDEKFLEELLEFADEWANDKVVRVLNDQVELTRLWIAQKYQLQNFEALLEAGNEELPRETQAMSESD